MKYEIYLLPLLISFALSAVLSLAVIFFAGKGGAVQKREGKRHIHKKELSRFGGVAIILAFVATLFFDKNLYITQSLWGIMGAIFLLLVMGIWDDLRELNWKTQLFFQIVSIAIVFAYGVHLEYITNPFGGVFLLSSTLLFLLGLLLTGAWAILLMNAMNWVDGVDGLSGGIAIIGALTIFFLSLKPEVNQPPVAIIAIALVGAIGGFLFFNFHPARILAGTSGSMFFGFILAALSIFAGAKIATTLLVLAIPIGDALWVMATRASSGQSIFKADSRHLHHKLLELGWSQQKICLFFYGITALIAAVALNTRALSKLTAVILVIVLLVGVLGILRKKSYV